jgi:hypothetical protein
MAASLKVREVGTLKKSFLERFGKNQRRAALVARRSGQPMGIRRFKTWEEVEACRKAMQKKN